MRPRYNDSYLRNQSDKMCKGRNPSKEIMSTPQFRRHCGFTQGVNHSFHWSRRIKHLQNRCRLYQSVKLVHVESAFSHIVQKTADPCYVNSGGGRAGLVVRVQGPAEERDDRGQSQILSLKIDFFS